MDPPPIIPFHLFYLSSMVLGAKKPAHQPLKVVGNRSIQSLKPSTQWSAINLKLLRVGDDQCVAAPDQEPGYRPVIFPSQQPKTAFLYCGAIDAFFLIFQHFPQNSGVFLQTNQHLSQSTRNCSPTCRTEKANKLPPFPVILMEQSVDLSPKSQHF